jgi:hypothetical protein
MPNYADPAKNSLAGATAEHDQESLNQEAPDQEPDLDQPQIAPPVARYVLTSVSARSQDLLRGVLADKLTVQKLKQAHAMLLDQDHHDAAAALEIVSKTGGIGRIDLSGTEAKRSFLDDKQALLLRTLTKRVAPAQAPVDDQPAPVSRTPAKVERNTLNNRIGDLNIQLTPSTLIAPEVNVSPISRHPDRPRWSNMPSVMYATPAAQGEQWLG